MTQESNTLEKEGDELMQLVGFKLGNEMYGVNILMVQEIIRSAPITSVPNSPVFVEGVINLRGGIIPVVDLRRRLNIASDLEDRNKDWIIILDIDGRITGFIVDFVTEVLKVNENNIEAAPDIIGAGLDRQYIRGVCEVKGTLLVLLDFHRILFADEIESLEAFSIDQLEEV